ncbi:serine/threonine protein kinase [Chloropicon primus]|uniref:Serine/threonine protein kinase n=2 Tax=Chloropicon primus TaxID=1764295 RepID=A0A5B8MX73_9CHLO|nr:serine/threonine protein kinase [Chloropicon primus]UPR03492.1 serine/threonine protein kinase [Chloropicon primus]|eukprot:QDZ24285.1 serine/threonine protein kinase [Chloropicon primus]
MRMRMRMTRQATGTRRNVRWTSGNGNANALTRMASERGNMGMGLGMGMGRRGVVGCRALTEIPRGKNGEWPDEEDWEKRVEEEHGGEEDETTTTKKHQHQHGTTTATAEAAAAATSGGAPPSGGEAAPPLSSASSAPPLPSSSEEEGEAFTLGWPRTLHECYDVEQEIGRGSFGVVRLARERWPVQFTSSPGGFLKQQAFAVKSIPKRPKRRTRRKRFVQGDEEEKRNAERLVQRQKEKLLGEVAFMVALNDCPYAAQLVGAYEDAKSAHLVVELCSGGDLKHLLKRRGTLTEKEASEVMFTALNFIKHCHEKGFVFSDVKPANFMLKFKLNDEGAPSGNQALVVKGIDFGCSQRIGDPSERNMLTKRTGTPAYWSPEVFMRFYDHQADVWSCGMMMYEMLMGKLPFWDDIEKCTPKEVHRGVMRGKLRFDTQEQHERVYDSLDSQEEDLSEEDYIPRTKPSPLAQDLIIRMLDKDPKARITVEEALEHPWLQQWH